MKPFPVIPLLALVALGTASVPAAEPVKAKPNRLASESSPYLLQHANNPVDWYPWGEEAFAKAKKENKLVFLSIGYSSCHWCHVMEKESFADAAIAKTMNESFVCIKVDREERPDIDEIYMAAIQVTGQSGGWPLTMFLTAEGKPIFGGTYFPPEDRKVGEDTAPGMKSILKKVFELNRDKGKDLAEQADRIAEMTRNELNKTSRGLALVDLNQKLVADGIGEFEFDPEFGGLARKANSYRGAKFPRAAALQFLLEQSAKPGREALAKSLQITLDQLAQGGIYDHLGGGFHRYSTERTWTVPHFEKMLYDQAQLVELYCEAFRQKPNPAYEGVIRETLAFVERELMAPEGYFYSALDADSDGEEGLCYVWTAKELEMLLGTGAEAEMFRAIYALDKPNFEGKYSILRMPKSLLELAKERKTTEAELLKTLEPLKAKLLAVRQKRNQPFRDTKLIAAWNGQMIAAYASAGRVLKEPKYLKVAETASEFLLKTMRTSEGRLKRIYAAKPGMKASAQGIGFLDDYAYFTHGLLNLHAATKNAKWLEAARELADKQFEFFGDGTNGGYFTTPKDGETHFARGRDSYDGAQPSANGVAARNNLILWENSKGYNLRMRLERDLKRSVGLMKMQPSTVPILLQTLDAALARQAIEPGTENKLPEAPKNPKNSSDVVSIQLETKGVLEGMESFTITLKIAEGWHIYANPVENKDLLASTTTVEMILGGKPADSTVTFPPGTAYKGTDGEYRIYKGNVKIEAKAKAGAVSAKVKIIACNEKNCLLPSTVIAEVKK